MSTTLKWVIAVLVIVAVFFGYQIYTQKGGQINAPAQTQNMGADQPPTTQTGTPTVSELLNSPASTASDSVKQAYGNLVISAAVKTNTINVSSCTSQPTVASFPNQSTVTLVNNDALEHRIVFDAKTFFVVPAKSKKDIKADFGKGAGIYGYGCDNSQKAVGMVFVTPQ